MERVVLKAEREMHWDAVNMINCCVHLVLWKGRNTETTVGGLTAQLAELAGSAARSQKPISQNTFG